MYESVAVLKTRRRRSVTSKLCLLETRLCSSEIKAKLGHTHTHTEHMNHMRDDERDVSHQKEGQIKTHRTESGQTTSFRRQKQTNTTRSSCFSSKIQMFLSFLWSLLPCNASVSHVTCDITAGGGGRHERWCPLSPTFTRY